MLGAQSGGVGLVRFGIAEIRDFRREAFAGPEVARGMAVAGGVRPRQREVDHRPQHLGRGEWMFGGERLGGRSQNFIPASRRSDSCGACQFSSSRMSKAFAVALGCWWAGQLRWNEEVAERMMRGRRELDIAWETGRNPTTGY